MWREDIGLLYIIICFSLSRPARAQQQTFVQQNPPGRCSPKLCVSERIDFNNVESRAHDLGFTLASYDISIFAGGFYTYVYQTSRYKNTRITTV